MRMTGYGTWVGNCKEPSCRKEFVAYKRTGVFCSAKCRVKWSRRKKMIQRHKNDALYAVRALMALSKESAEFGDEINQAFRQIEDALRDGRRLRPDDETKGFQELLYGMSLKRNTG